MGGCYAAGFEGGGRGFELGLEAVFRSWTIGEAGSAESLQGNAALCAHVGLRRDDKSVLFGASSVAACYGSHRKLCSLTQSFHFALGAGERCQWGWKRRTMSF